MCTYFMLIYRLKYLVQRVLQRQTTVLQRYGVLKMQKGNYAKLLTCTYVAIT